MACATPGLRNDYVEVLGIGRRRLVAILPRLGSVARGEILLRELPLRISQGRLIVGIRFEELLVEAYALLRIGLGGDRRQFLVLRRTSRNDDLDVLRPTRKGGNARPTENKLTHERHSPPR